MVVIFDKRLRLLFLRQYLLEFYEALNLCVFSWSKKAMEENAGNDWSLLSSFKNGGNKEYAFTQLLKKYQERLYWHIRRLVIEHEDANDILQNVFIKMWKHLDNFREESNLYTWLYRIATNECISWLEKEKRNTHLSLNDADNPLLQTLTTQKGFDANRIEWKLQQAIQTLPEKQRVVFNLRYFDEMPYEKMSEVLGTSVGALKASYHHAVKKIEVFIAEN